jgi:hypothetical protein
MISKLGKKMREGFREVQFMVVPLYLRCMEGLFTFLQNKKLKALWEMQ